MNVTAKQLRDAQTTQVQNLVTALLLISETVNQMEGSQLENFKLWLGGLPQDIRNVGGQSFYYAQQLAQAFDLNIEVPTEQPAVQE